MTLLSLLLALRTVYAEEPETGASDIHPAMRVGIDGGIGQDAGTTIGVEYRLLLHDFLDPGPGHSKTALGEIAKVRFSYLTRPRRLRLDEFTLLRMHSTPPRNTAAEKEWSFKVRLGLETIRDKGCQRCIAGVAEAGIGVAYLPLLPVPATFFVTLDAELALGAGFAHVARPGLGPSSGLRIHFSERVATLLLAKYRLQFLTAQKHSHQVQVEGRWALSPLFALRLWAAHWPDGWESNTGIFYYF